MKKKRITFSQIDVGEYFIRYRKIHIKTSGIYATDIENGSTKFIYYTNMVIPVTVTIKVKEK